MTMSLEDELNQLGEDLVDASIDVDFFDRINRDLRRGAIPVADIRLLEGQAKKIVRICADIRSAMANSVNNGDV